MKKILVIVATLAMSACSTAQVRDTHLDIGVGGVVSKGQVILVPNVRWSERAREYPQQQHYPQYHPQPQIRNYHNSPLNAVSCNRPHQGGCIVRTHYGETVLSPSEYVSREMRIPIGSFSITNVIHRTANNRLLSTVYEFQPY